MIPAPAPPEFEDEVRAMLARRAADVSLRRHLAPEGRSPAPLTVPLTARRWSQSRRPPRRWRSPTTASPVTRARPPASVPPSCPRPRSRPSGPARATGWHARRSERSLAAAATYLHRAGGLPIPEDTLSLLGDRRPEATRRETFAYVFELGLVPELVTGATTAHLRLGAARWRDGVVDIAAKPGSRGMPASVDVTLLDVDGRRTDSVSPSIGANGISLHIVAPQGTRPFSVLIRGRDRSGKVIGVAAAPVVTSGPAPSPG